MEWTGRICKSCTGELSKISANRWKCDSCSAEFDDSTVVVEMQRLKKLPEEARKGVIQARQNLYKAVTAEYISNVSVDRWANEIKKYLPDDFLANFYLTAISPDVRKLTRYIREVDVEKNYDDIGTIIKFLIKSLKSQYSLEVSNLIARAYERRDKELFHKFITELEIEKEKVDSGVYVTKQPRDVFIAYSSKDWDSVSKLVEYLECEAGLTCFVAARNLRHGQGAVENYNRALKEAMDNCRSFVFVSSTNSRDHECDALKVEMSYIKETDIRRAPAEYHDNYAAIPEIYKKHRVEYRIGKDEWTSADRYVKEFFDGYERANTAKEVGSRVIANKLKPIATQESSVLKETQVREPQRMPPVEEDRRAVSSMMTMGPTSETLLKRAFILLRESNWSEADQKFESVLDRDPENARAYLGKLLVEYHASDVDQLGKLQNSFERSANYKNAMRYGDKQLQDKLKEQLNAIKYRQAEAVFNDAERLMRSAGNDISILEQAIAQFNHVEFLPNTSTHIAYCQKRIAYIKKDQEDRRLAEIERQKREAERRRREEEQRRQEEEQMRLEEEQRKDSIYESALDLIVTSRTEEGFVQAKQQFDSIEGYKDAESFAALCQNEIEKNNSRNDFYLKFGGVCLAFLVITFCLLRYGAMHTVVIGVLIALTVACIAWCTLYLLGLYFRHKRGWGIESPSGYFYAVFSIQILYCAITIFTAGRARSSAIMISKEDYITLFIWCSALIVVATAGLFLVYKKRKGYKFFRCAIAVAVGMCLIFLVITCIAFPYRFHKLADGSYELMGVRSLMINSDDLPNSYLGKPVVKIGDGAFKDWNELTSVTIPDSVTSIGEYAFRYCSSLTSITIPDSVTSIGDDAFWGCSSLASITIPDSVTSIGDSAFECCSSLTSITIPDSVTSIGYEAFYYCDSLTSVYYGGTASEWNGISIDSYNYHLTRATRYYYSETQPTTAGNYWHYVDGEPTPW